ncbi:MAG: hypothetical protein NC408_08160 [Candidatus Gastranaerophilales bacterium]|nr:hypothetical protein [Candidatus Gastranaerophilales bacterium]MCM1073243.1 hypothetical protein [Bacteroides sp.]
MALEVFNFKKKRTLGGAFVITLMYFVIAILLAGIAAGISQLLAPSADAQEAFAIGQKVGGYVALIYCSVLAVLYLVKKIQYQNFLAIFVCLLTVLGALLAAALGAFLPLMFLAMFEDKSVN